MQVSAGPKYGRAGKSHHQSPGRLSRPQEEGSHKEALLGWRGAVSSSGPAPGSKFPWGCFNMFQHVSKFLFPVWLPDENPMGNFSMGHLAGHRDQGKKQRQMIGWWKSRSSSGKRSSVLGWGFWPFAEAWLAAKLQQNVGLKVWIGNISEHISN